MTRRAAILAGLAFCALAAVAAVVEAEPMQPYGNLDPATHALVFGVPRSGKSTFVRWVVSDARRVVYFAPTPDYRGHGERCVVAELEEDPSLLDGITLRLVVEPEDASDMGGEFARLLNLLCEECPRRGGVLLVADEVWNYNQGEGKAALFKLHLSAHHYGVASVCISQVAVGVPLTCRRTATQVWSLYQHHPADLEALAEVYGETYAAQVAAWKPGDEPVSWTLPTMHRSV